MFCNIRDLPHEKRPQNTSSATVSSDWLWQYRSSVLVVRGIIMVLVYEYCINYSHTPQHITLLRIWTNNFIFLLFSLSRLVLFHTLFICFVLWFMVIGRRATSYVYTFYALFAVCWSNVRSICLRRKCCRCRIIYGLRVTADRYNDSDKC